MFLFVSGFSSLKTELVFLQILQNKNKTFGLSPKFAVSKQNNLFYKGQYRNFLFFSWIRKTVLFQLHQGF
jgi:hypothetical protein